MEDLALTFGTTGRDLLYPSGKDRRDPIWQPSRRSWNFARILLREIVGLSVLEGREERGMVPCKTLVV